MVESKVGRERGAVAGSVGPLTWVGLLLLLAFTLATRLHTLDISPTHDTHATFTEAADTDLESLGRYLTLGNLRTLREAPPAELSEKPQRSFPGFYLLFKAYLGLFGADDFVAARALSSAFSFLCVALLAWIALRHVGPGGALAVAAVGATSPLLQYHGSYIRFYAALIFASALSLAAVLAWAERVELPRARARRLLGALGISALIWLPFTIHASGALSVFACGLVFLLRVVPRLSFGERWLVLGANALLATPPLVNTVVFLVARGRNAELMPEDYVMSTSALSFLASLVFNFNGLLFLGIAFALCTLRGALRLWLYLPYAAALALCFVGVTIRPTLFRPDYLLSLLPATYLLFGDALQRLGAALGGTRLAAGVLGLVVVGAVAFTFPTFVSNVAIDQDRFDYRRVVQDVAALAGGAPTLVYSHSPASFPRELPPNLRVAHLDERGKLDESPYQRVFYLLGWRREGFRKKFQALVDPEPVLRGARLVLISGRNRLDARDNLLFVFER